MRVSQIEYNRNAIYGDVGTIIGVWTATVFYERTLWNFKFEKESGKKSKKRDLYLNPFVKVGYGGLAALLFDEGTYAIGQLGFLLGGNKSYFEGALGGFYNIEQSIFLNDFVPSFSAGYRMQKIDGHFLLRAGISLPETVYFGIGFAF